LEFIPHISRMDVASTLTHTAWADTLVRPYGHYCRVSHPKGTRNPTYLKPLRGLLSKLQGFWPTLCNHRFLCARMLRRNAQSWRIQHWADTLVRPYGFLWLATR